ncbi:MAG: L,D-transpeptidase family protein [Gammaproteobacteria bacterium]
MPKEVCVRDAFRGLTVGVCCNPCKLASSWLAWCSLPLLLAFGSPSVEAVPAEHIRQYVEDLIAGEEVRIDGATVASRELLPAFYEATAFEPAWKDEVKRKALYDAIGSIHLDGLTSGDYHPKVLRAVESRLAAAEPGPERELLAAQYDVLLTDSLIRVAYHLSFGKVDPERLDRHWNIARTFEAHEPLARLQGAMMGSDLAAAISALRPQHWSYNRLRNALAAYRAIAGKGGWATVTTGKTLEFGVSGPRVEALRARLEAEGFIEGDGETGTIFEAAGDDNEDAEAPYFDEALEQAVKQFQARYRLAVDGRAGPKTLAAMNIPVAARIDQIRVNLERARWVLHDLDDVFVLVDIAGFQLHEYRDNGVEWSTRVQVGRPYRKTPVFKSKIEYMVVNPTWTVPPTILRKDVLPAVREDPEYLRRKNIGVFSRSGEPIDPGTVDWSQYASGGFPYRLRQAAGRGNALGRVKFIFPNDYAVYLHETPSQHLFDRASRAFSSGCIRVQEPMGLAERLLRNSPSWSMARFETAIASGKTRTVMLDEPVTVMLMYWTVSVPEEGVVEFKNDIYNRDRAVLEGLNADFRFRKRPVTRGPILWKEQKGVEKGG